MMGQVMTEITLVNSRDERDARGGYISVDKVRKETVQAIVDTGTMRLFINEELYQKLGLYHFGDIFDILADGRRLPCKVTSDVRIYCNHRRTVVNSSLVPIPYSLFPIYATFKLPLFNGGTYGASNNGNYAGKLKG
jgi:hypothetical protein